MPVHTPTSRLLLALLCSSVTGLSSITYRTGRTTDEWTIATTLAAQLMNPLHIDATNFVVAVDGANTDESLLVGWAQIRPLATSGSVLRDPNQYNAPQESFTTEQAVDDELWQEFEEDESVVVPEGWASLPWTKEYRDFSGQAKKRRERRLAIQQVQQRQAESAFSLWELASVYVRPKYRRQGIGSELVRQCLQTHVQKKRSLSHRVYLLTLQRRAAWYATQFDFQVVSDARDIPKSMQFEIAAGTLITKLIGEELCCMRATDATMNCIGDFQR